MMSLNFSTTNYDDSNFNTPWLRSPAFHVISSIDTPSRSTSKSRIELEYVPARIEQLLTKNFKPFCLQWGITETELTRWLQMPSQKLKLILSDDPDLRSEVLYIQQELSENLARKFPRETQRTALTVTRPPIDHLPPKEKQVWDELLKRLDQNGNWL